MKKLILNGVRTSGIKELWTLWDNGKGVDHDLNGNRYEA
jgi:hypothetical protein